MTATRIRLNDGSAFLIDLAHPELHELVSAKLME